MPLVYALHLVCCRVAFDVQHVVQIQNMPLYDLLLFVCLTILKQIFNPGNITLRECRLIGGPQIELNCGLASV